MADQMQWQEQEQSMLDVLILVHTFSNIQF